MDLIKRPCVEVDVEAHYYDWRPLDPEAAAAFAFYTAIEASCWRCYNCSNTIEDPNSSIFMDSNQILTGVFRLG